MAAYFLHFMHHDGRFFGDAMPYYWKGQYHLYYLLNGSGHNDINHEHAVSTDLVHWKQLEPSIYHEDNCAFTGSYLTTPDGIHHCFFTRWKENNPSGRESIGHATSSDLVTWTKTSLHLVPDGILYSAGIYRDFRDPCVFFDPKLNLYHMLLLANPKDRENGPKSWDEHWIQGHYTSRDLETWIPQKPLDGNFADECPDYFYQQNKHYLHGCHHYAIGDAFQGPYMLQPDSELDLGARAPKFCYDGHRRVWFGGFIGGPATLPRTLNVLPDGNLGLSFVHEIIEATSRLVETTKAKKGNISLKKECAHRISLKGDALQEGFLTLTCNPSSFSLVFDFSKKRVSVYRQGKITKETALGSGKDFRVDIIADQDIVEIIWNDFRAFSGQCDGVVTSLSFELTEGTITATHYKGQ